MKVQGPGCGARVRVDACNTPKSRQRVRLAPKSRANVCASCAASFRAKNPSTRVLGHRGVGHGGPLHTLAGGLPVGLESIEGGVEPFGRYVARRHERRRPRVRAAARRRAAARSAVRPRACVCC
eukprot:COSAG02_NODE_8221_length_2654_cov_1.570646_2_plen_123_part_01